MTDGFITVPNTTFFTDNINLINTITSVIKDVVAPIFLIYFTFIFLKSLFGGNISELPLSLWRFFFIGLMLVYFYPIFTASYNGFSSLGNSIFNIKNLEMLNTIDQKLQYFAANPDAPDTPHSYGPFGSVGVGSIFHARSIEYWFIRLLFFICHISYTAVFYIRQVILILAISILPYLLVTSFWETARNRAIGLVTMIAEILFWYPVLCICLHLIFKINNKTGASNWLKGVSEGLAGFFESNGPGYMLGEIMIRISMVIIATLSAPIITYMIFNGRAVYAAGLIIAPVFSAARMVSHQVSRLTNALTSVKAAKVTLKAAGSGLNYAGNTLRAASKNTASFIKQPTFAGAAKIAFSPVSSLRYSFPHKTDSKKEG